MTARSEERYPVGTEVEFTGRGTVTARAGGLYEIQDAAGRTHTVNLDSRHVTGKLVVPPHEPTEPGQLWLTGDGMEWFTRFSRPGLSLRFMPWDQSPGSGYQTLAEELFFIQHPEASLIRGAAPRPVDEEGPQGAFGADRTQMVVTKESAS